ncbi:MULTISPECIES: peptide IlvX [Klebsiella pneumoniae complex]|nr:peptide IlvX [Klebsiella pneumoniae]MCJ1814342.1 peptide IlvX [Klebsiella quasipneumoniae subsp. similipneumoniae]MCQ3864864.1 peptide IlvX [Klebsiella quasipneumoniae]MBW4957692.1 peptide IlvX [Klebsiella pneumoniae]MCJ1871287.1 peptide IlvX [Klebsiella quasipneumoniae subsp. similipneumoniae]
MMAFSIKFCFSRFMTGN